MSPPSAEGKGFAGTMKRHNFSGQKATHGTHRVHRKPGSDRRLRHARPESSKAPAWPVGSAARR